MWLPLSRRRPGRAAADAGRLSLKMPDPRPGRVDQHAGGRNVFASARLEHQPPDLAALGAQAARARADQRAALGGIERIEHDQAGIVGLAIGIFETVAIACLQRRAERVARQIDGAGRRQDFAAAEMVVDEEAEPQEPARAQARLQRQHEAHRPDQVRRHAQQHLALGERFAHQAETSRARDSASRRG